MPTDNRDWSAIALEATLAFEKHQSKKEISWEERAISVQLLQFYAMMAIAQQISMLPGR